MVDLLSMTDWERCRVDAYLKRCIDGIKDRLEAKSYVLGIPMARGDEISVVVHVKEKTEVSPANMFWYWAMRERMFEEKLYCVVNTKNNWVTVKKCEDGKEVYSGPSYVFASFSQIVYGGNRRGLLRIPRKL